MGGEGNFKEGTWPCPRCRGLGHNLDGSAGWSDKGFFYNPPSDCHLCEGSGWVRCAPTKKRRNAR